MESGPKEVDQHPGVHFPPPLLFVVAVGLGVLTERFFPYPLSNLVVIPGRPIIGWIGITAGATILIWALLTFFRNRTAVYPNQPAKLVVDNGPYGYSRNPMYVALTAINFGVAMLADNLWMLLLLPVVLVSVSVFIIRREEAYLKQAFGDEYTDYCNRVRRWV